jgi:long-subunit fatty acid transport protein
MFMVLLITQTAFAAHPLITDDSGTNGKGNFQFELNSQFGYDKESSDGITEKERSAEVKTSLSYGITDSADIILGLPYQWNRTEEDGMLISDENGISDVSLELKWRFYEHEGLSLALKPGLTLPTGSEDKGLGTGKTGYSLFFIASKKIGSSAFHINAGYLHNDYKLETDKDAQRKDLWHFSVAGTYEIVENLQLIANTGIEKNSDMNSKIDPVFALGGLIWSVTKNVDVDMGFKMGLTQPETDYAILTGLTLRF